MITVGRIALMGDWDTAPVPDGCVAVRLVPSHIEGYGWDLTTQVMLLSLQNNVPVGGKVMDFGAGTGVLALAALALGAKQADAVEWQEVSRAVASKNAKVNKATRMSIHKVAPANDYNLVLCNLLAGETTIGVLPIVTDRLLAGGRIILTSRASEWDAVRTKANELGLVLEGSEPYADERNGEWFLGVFTWPK